MTGYLFFRRLQRYAGVVWLGCVVLMILAVVSSVLLLGTDVPVEMGAKWAFILFGISSVIWCCAWFMVKLLEPNQA
jgi:hypothetical protein